MSIASPSSLQFVYPFRFAANTLAARVAAVNATQWPGLEAPWKRLALWADDLTVEVAQFLNPQDDCPGCPEGAYAWEVDGNALSSPKGLGASAEWKLLNGRREIPVRLRAVQLVLFPGGVGALILRLEPLGEEIADWLDVLHAGRHLRRAKSSSLRLERRTGIDPNTRAPKYEPYFPELGGGLAKHPEGAGLLADLIYGLLQSVRLSNEYQEWWQEVFVAGQMLPFAVIYALGVPASEQPAFLYRVENFFHATQEVHLGASDLVLDRPPRLPYAGDQWFFFSLDGGGFLAFDPPDTPFFRDAFPVHLTQEYFLLFLISLYQRFALTRLADDAARGWRAAESENLDAREAEFRITREALMAFTAQGYFPQVVQRQHHHRCYRRWQETFQIDRLYADVSRLVNEMHDFLLLRRNARIQQQVKRLELRLRQIAFVLAPPALILSILSNADIHHPATAIGGALGGLAFGFTLWALLNRNVEK